MLLILIYDLWLTCWKPSLDLITEGGGHFSRMRLEICLLFCAILFSCWVSILLPVQACLRGGITAPSLKCWPILEFTQESQLHNPDFGGNFPLVVFGLTHSKNADSWFTTSLWKKKMPLFKNRRDCWVVLWKMSAMTDESDPHYQPTVRIFQFKCYENSFKMFLPVFICHHKVHKVKGHILMSGNDFIGEVDVDKFEF